MASAPTPFAPPSRISPLSPHDRRRRGWCSACSATRVDTAGVAGLVKTAALEWSAEWKCITVADDVEPLAAAAAELAHGGVEREVRLGRQRAICTRVEETIGHVVRPLPEGPWIVSGGARGVTATCGLALARAGARRIVLMGRTPLEDEPAACQGITDEAALKRALIAQAAGKPDLRAIGRQVSAILAQREIRATIRGIEAAGAEVRYEPVDVADAAEVSRAVAAAREVWGPIRGLVHGAGVLADKRLGEKTREQFESVLRPKLDGVRALLDACGSDPLEQICFFSSVAAHSGNPGQSDYAAANATLDRLAVDEQARRGAACHVVSIAWGPWDGGMVTESLAKHFTARGISLIPQEAGARAFVDELRSGVSTQVIIGCGLDQMRDARRERVRVEVSALPVLQDHRIGDSVVLPMTMALDTLLGEGRRTLGPACELRDLQLLQGLVLADGIRRARDAQRCLAVGTRHRQHVDAHVRPAGVSRGDDLGERRAAARVPRPPRSTAPRCRTPACILTRRRCSTVRRSR